MMTRASLALLLASGCRTTPQPRIAAVEEEPKFESEPDPYPEPELTAEPEPKRSGPPRCWHYDDVYN